MDSFALLISLFAGAIGYLFGSIPFGLVLTRLAGLGDIRDIGSGNIGATNVLRTGNKGLAALTLLLDILKGALAVLFVSQLGFSTNPPAEMLAGLGAFVGHLFPIWLGFKGGKGVATYIGVLAALDWQAAIAFCTIWLIAAASLRYSSLSALIAAVIVPVGLLMMPIAPTLAVLVSVMSALLIWKHEANIRRLWAGEEPKIGAKTKA